MSYLSYVLDTSIFTVLTLLLLSFLLLTIFFFTGVEQIIDITGILVGHGEEVVVQGWVGWD